MKLNLYVDDLRLAPYGWELARTIERAIYILDTMDVEYLSVDHDIECNCGEGANCHCDFTEDYTPVVRFAARLPKDRRPKVSCHSGNGGAYDKYRRILEAAGEKLHSLDALLIQARRD